MPEVTWDPDHDPDVRVERDGRAVRQILHLARPFTHDGATSEVELAATYLRVLADFLGIDPTTLPPGAGTLRPTMWERLLRVLKSTPLLSWLGRLLSGGGVQLEQKPTILNVRDGESVAVIFGQVSLVNLFGVTLPILGAGIRVMIATSPFRVTSVYSTLRYGLRRAGGARRRSPIPTNASAAASLLHIDSDAVEGIFFYERPQSTGRRAAPTEIAPVVLIGRMEGPGSNVPKEGRELPYRDYFDLDLWRVTRSEVMASNVTGLGFRVDPRSQSGQSEPGPYRPGTELDAYAEDLSLPDLAAPNLMQELHGPRVYVAQDNPLGIDPPTEPAGADFDFTSRTDNFAAVSAYHHCDGAFRMVEALGFPLAKYFSENVKWNKFPIRVVHRAPIRPGPAVFDGRTVNALVVGDKLRPQVVGEIRFALGDLSDRIKNPIGIATDARFAWHEFGHVLLIAATGKPEFPFAHSAGDTLAAIICDLDSVAAAVKPAKAWRGVTFPWVEALRRHDRPVDKGWAWHGSLYDRATYADLRDPSGYRAEQILSSTLFRLYLSLGGDAWNGSLPNRAARRAAAAYTVYLVVGAIQALGPALMTPALDAKALAGVMMHLDVVTPYLLPNAKVFKAFKARLRRGGAVHKVVRWAFERQGLYVGSGAWPVNGPGKPEAVDVYIEDGRQGEYEYAQDWDSTAPDVRVVDNPSPNASDTPPHANHLSYVFVRVWNRGTQANPPAATVKVFATTLPGARPPRWRLAGFLNPWTELTPDTGAVTTAVVGPGAFVDFGPFKWQPLLRGHYSLLACVDAPGDRCNALAPTLPCAVGPTRLAHLVPFDNNTAHRRVRVT